MTATVAPPAASPAEGAARRRFWSRAARLLVAALVIALLVARWVSRSPLWLDEAQTVEIARRSVSGLLHALREDGAPPLYYLLLHGWMRLFGTGDFAVRSLSSVFATVTVPVLWLAARRWGADRRVAATATLLLVANPFAIRYATEARMYALVLLLVTVALVTFERCWRAGGAGWVVASALVTAALLLTQYWALFLFAVVGLAALVATVRGRRPARRVLIAVVVGCAGFAPWLPSFLWQSKHTGAPWASPPGLATAFLVPSSWSGGGLLGAGALLAFVYYVLVVLALAGRRAPGGVTLGRPVRRTPLLLLALTLATMLVGVIASDAGSNAYASRYSAIVLAPFLIAVAWGVHALPRSTARVVVGVAVVLGALGGARLPFELRTQAGFVADLLRAYAAPTDLVVFCPDQLGPAAHRLLPSTGQQVVYPTMGSPAMVDWVDYAARNKAADPDRFARGVLARAGTHRIWLVYAEGYPTFSDDCARLLLDFTAARGAPAIGAGAHHAFEHDRVAVFGPVAGAVDGKLRIPSR